MGGGSSTVCNRKGVRGGGGEIEEMKVLSYY